MALDFILPVGLPVVAAGAGAIDMTTQLSKNNRIKINRGRIRFAIIYNGRLSF